MDSPKGFRFEGRILSSIQFGSRNFTNPKWVWLIIPQILFYVFLYFL